MDAKTEAAEESGGQAEDAEGGAEPAADPRSRKLRELLAETLIARLTGREPAQDDRWRP